VAMRFRAEKEKPRGFTAKPAGLLLRSE